MSEKKRFALLIILLTLSITLLFYAKTQMGNNFLDQLK